MKVIGLYLFCILLIFSLNTSIGAQPGPAGSVKASSLEGPLSLSVKSIDESHPSHRTVHYSIRNNTDKAVRASVFRVEKNPGGNSTLTSYYGRFAGKSVHESVLKVDGKYQTEVSIEIDFVLFTDGSTWGSDSLRRSGEVFAYYKGKEAAVDHFKQLADANDIAGMIEIFATELPKVEPPTVPTDMAGKTKKAFLAGYRSTVLTLKRDFEQRGIKGFADRLKNPQSF